MRWKSVPEDKEKLRYKRGFLIIPRWAYPTGADYRQGRWLERARWSEEYDYYLRIWRPHEWLD